MKTFKKMLPWMPWALLVSLGVASAGGLQGTGASVSGTATSIACLGGAVDVSLGDAPSPGDMLTAIDATHAHFTKGGGGGGFFSRSGTTVSPTTATDLVAAQVMAIGSRTVTSDSPALNIDVTPNNSGAVFDLDDGNLAGTTYLASSTIISRRVNGTRKFKVSTTGQITTGLYDFPSADGSAGQTITTDGSGHLSFSTPTGGGGGGGGSGGFNPSMIGVLPTQHAGDFGPCSDGTYLWVPDAVSNLVQIFDPVKRINVASVAVGGEPQGCCFDGTYVWVTNFNDGTVTQINASTRVVANTVTVGTRPEDCCYDGTYVWVTNYNDGTVSQITASTHTVANTVTVGTHPYGICFDGTYVWATNFSSGTVSQITASTHTVANTVTVGTNPIKCCFDGTYVWVVNHGDGTLSQITASTHTVANTVTLGGSLWSCCYDGTYVWVSDASQSIFPAGQRVFQVNASTHAAINSVPFMISSSTTALHGIVYDSVSKVVWVVDFQSGLAQPIFTAQ